MSCRSVHSNRPSRIVLADYVLSDSHSQVGVHSRTGHCGRRTAFQSIVDNRATIHNPQRLCDNGTNFVHPALNSCGNEEACGLPTGNASTMWTIGKEFPPFVQARNLSREKLHTMTGMEAQHNETEAAGKPAAKKTTRTRKPRASKQATFIAEAPAMPIAIKEPGQFGRVNILNCQPSVEDDVYAARVEIGEQFTVSAQVFMEGRTKVGATAVLKNPRGRIMARVPMTVENAGLDLYTAKLQAGEHSTLNPWDAEFAEVKKQLGNWRVAIEGWEDTYGAWLHDARIKVDVLSDVENTLTSGSELLTRWASTRDANLNAEQRKTLREAAKSMMDTSLDAKSRLTFADNADIEALHETNPLRDGLTSSGDHVFHVERPKSSFSAWYQFFPRSEGAYLDDNGKKVQGNFHTAVSGLERAKAEGFNIVYLPPIFPIGVTNRKGPDGALNAGPDDPGSPFGIGSELGGHDTVDPLLGTMDGVYKQKFDLENGMVCYNPVDSHELIKYKKEYQIQDKLKICCVGRLEDQKGFDRLIKILGKLRLKNYVVDIYGTGTMKDELDDMIRKYGLEEYVHLKGFHKNIYEAMSNYHLLISPSRAEGFSLVVAEAMCMGIPVLSTDCAGPNELTDYGKYGILVENSDEALENAIQNIFEKKEALYKYHKLSEERSNIFKIENVMKEVEGNIYE